MNRRKLLRKLSSGAVQNVAFGDFVALVQGFGFSPRRVSGSHHIFGHANIPEQVNLQEVGGQVKPYQIRQFLRLVERYNMPLESEE
jgi:predicted RNA binding protein YcfA (HicA-like mRNA interferase family)